MLKFMRKHANSWFIKIMLGMIVVTFVGFFGWSATQGPFTRDVIATVDGEPILLSEYQAAYRQTHDLYRRMYGRDLDQATLNTLQIGRQAMETLVRARIHIREAEAAGLSVSDDELARHIERLPTFQRNGSFNRALYLEVLRRNRLAVTDYETEQRQLLLLRKMESVIRDSVKVTDPEIEEAYRWSHEGVKVRYMIYPTDRFEKTLKVKEDALLAYFEKEKARFRLPKKYRVAYVFAEFLAFEKTVKVTDENIAKVYEAAKEEYREPEKRQVRHILLKVAPEASQELAGEVKAKANALLKRIRAGEDFSKLADESSDDLNAGKGGNLGTIVRGEMDPGFEKAVFGLEEGEVAGPIRTPFGYHLVRLDKIELAKTRPLSEIKASIADQLRAARASDKARERIEKMWDEISEGRKLDSLPKMEGIRQGDSKLFTPDGKGLALPDAQRVAAAAFRLERGELGDPIEGDAGWYLIRVIDEQPSRLPELKEVRSEVEKAYVLDEAERLAEEQVKGWVKAVNYGKPLTEIAKAEGLKVTESPRFNRVEPLSSPQVGGDFYQKVFSLDSGKAGQAVTANGWMLYVVSERKAADLSKLKKDGGKFRQEYLRSKQSLVLRSWAAAQRRATSVELRPGFNL